ncbi:MAG: hypothetical protein Q8N85_03825 [Candidatus Omnitrophota bacterium]|nr:hypothetical protein [Candidatus Omnitrophota bacterium]
MTGKERFLIIIALFLIAVGILLSSFRGRYQYFPGGDIGGQVYQPKLFDTWTGDYK